MRRANERRTSRSRAEVRMGAAVIAALRAAEARGSGFGVRGTARALGGGARIASALPRTPNPGPRAPSRSRHADRAQDRLQAREVGEQQEEAAQVLVEV